MARPQDEELHEQTTAPHWQESYYFNWADLDGRIFGLTRLGFHDGGSRSDGIVVTIRDGEPGAIYAAIGVEIDPPAAKSKRAGVRVERLAYDMVEPRVSGVLLTASPTRAFAAKTAVDAAWGLGEAIVSGRTDPNRLVAGRVDGEVREELIGEKQIEVGFLGGMAELQRRVTCRLTLGFSTEAPTLRAQRLMHPTVGRAEHGGAVETVGSGRHIAGPATQGLVARL